MKIFKFSEFVEGLGYKLDSIHGNKGLDGYSLVVCKEAQEDSYAVSDIKKYSELVKEELWQIDKGGSALDDFVSGLDKENDLKYDEISGFWILTFEQDVRIYFTEYKDRLSSEYMNVRRVILPTKKKVTPAKEKRGYLLQDGKTFYWLPVLNYPSSIKDLMKWLKKKKVLGKTDMMIWNKDVPLIKIDKYSDGTEHKHYNWDIEYTYHWYPCRNLKTLESVSDYNNWVKSSKEYEEYKKFFYSYWTTRTLPVLPEIKPQILGVTQEMIQEFCDLQNDRTKVERK